MIKQNLEKKEIFSSRENYFLKFKHCARTYTHSISSLIFSMIQVSIEFFSTNRRTIYLFQWFAARTHHQHRQEGEEQKERTKKQFFFLQFFSVSCCFYLAIKLEDTFPSWTTVENVVRKKKKKGVRRDYKIAFNLYEPQKRGAKMWNFHSESIQGNWLKTLIKIRPNNGDEIVKIEVMRILDAIWRWINVIEGFLYHIFFFLLFRWKPQSF